MTLAAPTANPPNTRQAVSSTAENDRDDPMALARNTAAAITITLIRPNRSASGPANQAPTAQPSRADETTKPSSRSDIWKVVWIASTAPLMTAVS